jgi:hypothetical protein
MTTDSSVIRKVSNGKSSVDLYCTQKYDMSLDEMPGSIYFPFRITN